LAPGLRQKEGECFVEYAGGGQRSRTGTCHGGGKQTVKLVKQAGGKKKIDTKRAVKRHTAAWERTWNDP